jgi:hypothetical protein
MMMRRRRRMSMGKDYVSKLRPPTSILFIAQMKYEYG